ncbi:MAG: 50S ribosomal protein L3 [Cyanobacteria bacterium P01_A01_bin.68]
MRTGVVAKKIGMSHCYIDNQHFPVTVLKLEKCVVLGIKTAEKDGYDSVVLGYGSKKSANINKPMRGILKKVKVESVRGVAEFRISPKASLDVGSVISADHYVKNQYIDASSVSIGKGFAGGMKRHNFGGLEATHGVSISHRSHGSTGQCQEPGKVFKGKKMAGHLGSKNVTIQNLRIISVDSQAGVIYVKGSVPGAKGSLVRIRDSVKKSIPAQAPYPAAILDISKGVNNSKDNSKKSAKDDAEHSDVVKNDNGTEDES